MNAASPVVAASRSDIPEVVSLAAAYMWDSPAAAWLVPELYLRPGVLMAWYTIWAEHALRHGFVDMTRDGRNAAIWLDRTRPLPPPPQFLHRVTGTCGRHAVSLLEYEHLLEQHQPRSAHMRLVALAADTEAAAALLAHRHEDLDRIGIPAYTTASSTEQCAILTAAGYLVAPPCQLPGGPETWPLRRPSGTGHAALIVANPMGVSGTSPTALPSAKPTTGPAR